MENDSGSRAGSRHHPLRFRCRRSTPAPGPEQNNSDPFHPVDELTGPAAEYVNAPISAEGPEGELKPAEAIEHMRDVARLLHNWRGGNGSDRQSA